MFNILYRCPRTIPVMKPVHCMNQGVVTWSILLLRARPFTQSQPPLGLSIGPQSG